MKKSTAKSKNELTEFDKKYDATIYTKRPAPAVNKVKAYTDIAERENAEIGREYAPSINNVLVSRPRTFKDIQGLVLSLRRNEAVIVDVADIRADSLGRVLDYLSGAVFALGGSEKHVSKTIYMFTPHVNEIINRE